MKPSEVQLLVLRALKGVSDPLVIEQIKERTARRVTWSTMMRLVRAGLVDSETIVHEGHHRRAWYLTPAGWQMAADCDRGCDMGVAIDART